MATNPDKSSVERIKDVIRLLNLALEECERHLCEAEEAVRKSGQDNHPETKNAPH